MKVLSLWQPHASLCVVINGQTGRPFKTIETRSWSTNFRGPLAIHAGARKPRRVWTQDGPPVLYDPIAIERYLEIAEDGNNPGQFAYDWRGPLGAIVATCMLVDVVPIVEYGTDGHRDAGFTSYVLVTHPLRAGSMREHRLRLCDWSKNGWGEGKEEYGARSVDITDQLPYGDFTPGRYAWLLADVVPVDPPVPFKGGQGLTRSWEPGS